MRIDRGAQAIMRNMGPRRRFRQALAAGLCRQNRIASKADPHYLPPTNAAQSKIMTAAKHQRLPPWIRIRFEACGLYAQVDSLVRDSALHTVCESANCPNRQECFNRGVATVMILGDRCTRSCAFCAVKHGIPQPPDPSEPERVARLGAELGLRHMVITSVTRDDLPDGGAGCFAETIRRVKTRPGVTVEVLTPDFQGRSELVRTVLSAAPDVFNHNIETVRRLQGAIRPQADYDRSLNVLRIAAEWRPAVKVKSGLMLGLGETDGEVAGAMRDLLDAGCRLLTLGQYLAPSRRHHPARRYVRPEAFESLARLAREMGFAKVAAAPLVRSSYEADRMV